MEITTLGVGIDPTKAKSGAAEAVHAAENMATRMNAAGIKAEKAEKGVGAAAQDMGKKVHDAGEKANTAANKVANNGAWAKLRSSLTGLAGGVTGAFGAIGKAALTLGAAFGALQAAMLPVMAVMGTIRLGVGLLTDTITKAADFEDYNIQWAQLLGSFDAARDKMTMLSELAEKTPFNLPEIVKGSIGLQTLSQGLLTTRENLLLVGDAAAKAKQPFDTMADTIGRIYVNAKYGGEFIEQLKTILSQGIIGGDAFAAIKELGGTEANAGGKNFTKIWELMSQELGKAKNSMLLMSEATNGLFSTLSDGWDTFQRTFGVAINAGVRPLVRALTEEIGSWTEKAKEWAPAIEEASVKIAALVNVMRGSGGFELVMINAWDTVREYATRVILTLGDVMKNRFEIAAFAVQEQFDRMQTPEFWKGMSDQLKQAATEFVDSITLGLTSAARGLKSELSSFGSDLAKLGSGIVTLDGSKIKESLFGTAAPVAGARSGVTIPKRAPEVLSFSDAWAKNTPEGDSPAMLALKKRIAEQEALIQKKNAQSSDDSLLYKPNPGSGAGLATGGIDKDALSNAKKEMGEFESLAKRVIDSTRTPMEKYKETMGQLQTLQAKGMIDAETYARATTQAAEQYQSAVTQAAETAKQKAYEQMTPLQQLLAQWRDLGTAMRETSREIAGSISSNMTDALTDMITGAASVSDAFARMAQSIIADLVRMASQMLINWAIQKAIGFAVGAIGGGATGAVAATATTAAVHHTGGTVGEGSNFRTVPTSSFRNAPRFQHGGKVGSGETPAIMEPGEQVLTRDQASDIKARLGAGKREEKPKEQAVTILNVVDRSLIEQHIAANPSIILNAIGSNASKVRRALRV